MIFLSQLKTFMKNFIKKKQRPKLPLLNVLVTSLTKKISHKLFHHCETKYFPEKVTKSINSQTNIKFPGSDNLIA